MDRRFSIVNILSAVFECSAADGDAWPDESLPEFAFIGRSNVGKSSLLNLLAGEQGLARVSPVPGFTKLINFFTVDHAWRLVDLPGHGFAHGSRQHRARLGHSVVDYLEHRTNLCLVFVLLDSSLAPQAIDLEVVEWLVRHAVPFVFVFTKTDKVSALTLQTNRAAFAERIAPWFQEPPAVFTCSAATRQGRPELLGVIAEAMTAIHSESLRARVPNQSPASPSRQPRTGQKPKRRPDLNRPW